MVNILATKSHLFNLNDMNQLKCYIAIYVDVATLYSNCDQASDMWQQLKLASKLESDLQETVEWGKKWLIDFNFSFNFDFKNLFCFI